MCTIATIQRCYYVTEGQQGVKSLWTYTNELLQNISEEMKIVYGTVTKNETMITITRFRGRLILITTRKAEEET